MRITNSHHEQNIKSTKCTKMTEEEHKIHGMNGVVNNGNTVSKEECLQNSDTYSQGGRLKFFKNGKFILELARAREGEKVAWVPVPKKTFWPPQGSAPSVSAYRQESSTSLSVSDDNSSVQSSPWQRDHTWKQTSPQRNLSNHLTFYYRGRSRPEHNCMSYYLHRRPYTSLPSPLEPSSERTMCGTRGIKCNKCSSSSAISSKPHQNLMQLVQILWAKSSQVVNNITSPRKRILRELERVTIDDLSYKRCRGKVNQVLPVATQHLQSESVEVNGGSVEESRATSSKNCSYSITSLLGGKIEKRDDKLSSQFVPVPRMTHQNLLEETSYDTVDNPRVDVMTANSKRRSPVVAGAEYHPQMSPYHPHPPPYVPPYHLYHPAAPGYPVPSYYGATYGRGGYMPPVAPPPPPRPNGGATLYSPWAAPAYEQTTRDENISDVPLNLSKHAD